MRTIRQNRFAVCLCAVRRCCVVRIAYKCFLDCSLQEFFLFFRMANSISLLLLDFCPCSSSTLCRGQLPPAPLAKLSQLDRNCLRLEICSLSHKNSVRSAVHSCVRQICTCSADTPANDVNAVTIKFGLTLSGCPTDNIHSSTNAPAIVCSA